MAAEPVLRTKRLILRPLRPDDFESFAAMNADPEVMRFFPACLDRTETKALVARMQRHFARHGFGWWAVDVPGVTSFAGFVGLLVPAFQAHFTPCVEVGWRLPRKAWGKGYATEAGQASLDFAFQHLELEEVVSMAVTENHRSTNLMERLGMSRRPADDFGHPKLPFGDPLRAHVLYRLSRQAWTRGRPNTSR
ncbi:MAG: GNAT family N-acetyltransferase [Geminicoccaceae bacterium]